MDDHVYPQLYALEDEHWWFKGRRAVIWALLGAVDLPASPRVLDAGCGTGRNLIEFGALGRGWGVDPSPQAVEFCRQRGLQDVIQAGLEQLPFEDRSFDLLLAFDVLEHIERDDQALTELRRVADPNASLVITVPAYQWLWSHHDTSHHHKRRYTAPRLRERVTSAGWRVRRVTYFNSLLLAPIAVARRLSARNGGTPQRSDYDRAPKVLSAALQAPMMLEASLIARGHRLPAGVSIGMVCAPS